MQYNTFLTTLYKGDTEGVHLCAFADNKKLHLPPKNFMGANAEDIYDELDTLNQQGYGIFFSVNRTDGTGRKKQNISDINCFFIEDDGDAILPSNMPYHAKVKSSEDKYHYYYFVYDFTEYQFKQVMNHMVRNCGSDPSAKDSARVLRLPNFINNKYDDKPQVELLELNEDLERYNFETVKGLLKLEDIDASEPIPAIAAMNPQSEYCNLSKTKQMHKRALICSALDYIRPQSYDIWVRVMIALKNYLDDDIGLRIAHAWSSTDSRYNPAEIESKWIGFSIDGDSPSIGTIIKIAKDNGYNGKDINAYNQSLYGKIVNPDGKSIIPEDLSEHGLTQHIMTNLFNNDEIINKNGQFYIYHQPCWHIKSDNEIKRMILEHISNFHGMPMGDRFFNVNNRITAAILENVRSLSARQDIEFNYKPNIINVKNGELHFDDAGNITLQKHNKYNYFLSAIACNYNPDAQHNDFVDFLESCFKSDGDAQQKILCLRDMMFYCMLDSNHLEKMLILHGEKGANGKSTFIKIMQAMLGKNNYSAIPIDKLHDRFSSSLLEGKKVNFASEISEGQLISDSFIKSLVSGDEISAERKFKDTFTFRSTATLLFATNNLPSTRDHSDAFVRRLIIIQYNRSFSEEERDTGLEIRLTSPEALEGILNWCLQSAIQVLSHKKITTPESSKKAVDAWRGANDNVRLFAEECVTRKSRSCVTIDYLYEIYKKYMSYASYGGNVGVFTKIKFGKRMVDLGFKKLRNAKGYYYADIKIKIPDYMESSIEYITNGCFTIPEPTLSIF